MRRVAIGAVVSVGVVAVGVPPANGAATRAEYIAQVDPICQEMVQTIDQVAKGLPTDRKNKRFKSAARKLRRENAVYESGVPQIAAVEPPTTDAQTIGSWIQLLREQDPVAKRLARDYAHGQVKTKNYKRLRHLSIQAQSVVADFGFSYCQLL